MIEMVNDNWRSGPRERSMYFWKVGHFEALPVSIHMKLAFLCLYGLSLRFYLLRNESCLLV
ncbi:transmembrane protein [Arabidopsis thaliana]|uniref:Transmembrane protein n=1 Tax=Arabidopsis thaliana TaxID=3702 RepID=B3H600_ARATH|nr:uncharacterized protein AT2G29654 [Arabidopsis thaliana]AEC08288.1 transmembrane protein [Arabidopsis thaliana]|eukprot:NP_001118412.1 transmembrane protein [Arabidopsis thaliana]